MPNVWATKNGVWSDTTVWNTAVLPTASDAVWASGSTVLINQDINVVSLNNFVSGTIGAGGTFNCYSSQTITASLNTGTANLLTITGSGLTVSILGNINGSTTTNVNTLNIPSTLSNSTININGNIVGGTVTSNAVSLSTTGSTVNITGSIIGGSAATSYGINIASTTSIYNISGSTTGGTAALNPYGINLAGTSNTLNLTGSSIGGISSGGGGHGIALTGTNNNIRIIGNIIGGNVSTNYGLSIAATSAYTASIVGNIVASNVSSLVFGGATGVGTINITGSVFAGDNSSIYGIAAGTSTNFTLNISGSVYAGLSTSAYGIILSNACTNSTVTIIGNVYSTANTSYGVYNNSTAGIIIISGSAFAANAIGAYNNSTGQILINGSAVAGAFVGAHNQSTGILRVTSAVASTASAAINGVAAGGTTTFENATFALNGSVPWLGYSKIVSSLVNFLSSSLEGNRYKILIDSNNISQGLPVTSDVRLGTIYNSGANTGTLAMPSASQVLLGVAVDNTTGSASLTTGSIASNVWDTLTTTLTTTGSVGERLKNAATVSSVGDQLVALI